MLDKNKEKQKDKQSKTYIVCCLILAIMVLGVCYLMLDPKSKNGTVGLVVNKDGSVKFSASTVQQNNTNESLKESTESKRTPNLSN